MRKEEKICRSNIPPTDVFEGCRQKGKAKRDQRSMQAQKNVGDCSMYTPFLKFRGKAFGEIFILQKVLKFPKRLKKTKIKNPYIIPVHQTGILGKNAKQNI